MSEPYMYTDIDGDQLYIRPDQALDSRGHTIPVVDISVVDDREDEVAGVYVPLADVEQLVTAIRAAAGQDQPEDRRERYAGAILTALARDTTTGPKWGAAADAVMAVADTEYRAHDEWAKSVEDDNARLRAELTQARSAALTEAADALDESETLRDLNTDHMGDVHMVTDELRRMAAGGDERSERTAVDEITRLRAELAEARSAALTEAADIAESVAEGLRQRHEFERSTGALDVMTELRRMAAGGDE